MTAKVWCWKVKVTYLCGCCVTGNTIHNCNSTMSNCSSWYLRKNYNKECEDCILESHNGRNLSGGSGSSGKGKVTKSVAGEATGQLDEAVELAHDDFYEPVKPICYTESGRKVVTSG